MKRDEGYAFGRKTAHVTGETMEDVVREETEVCVCIGTHMGNSLEYSLQFTWNVNQIYSMLIL